MSRLAVLFFTAGSSGRRCPASRRAAHSRYQRWVGFAERRRAAECQLGRERAGRPLLRNHRPLSWPRTLRPMGIWFRRLRDRYGSRRFWFSYAHPAAARTGQAERGCIYWADADSPSCTAYRRRSRAGRLCADRRPQSGERARADFLVPALLGRGIAIWARLCFLGYERIADYAPIVLLMRGAEVAGGTAYLAFGGGLPGVIVIHSVSWAAEAVFSLWLIRSRLSGFAFWFSWRPAIELLKQGAVLGLGAAGYTWLVSGPIMMLRHTGIAMSEFGQFAIVSSITVILVGSVQAFASAALPALSRSAHIARPTLAYGRLTVLAAAGATILAAGTGWLLGRPVADLVLGPEYGMVGALLAPFMLIGGAILAPTGYAQTLLVSGRRWPPAMASIPACILLAVMLVPAAESLGARRGGFCDRCSLGNPSRDPDCARGGIGWTRHQIR